MFSGLIGVSAGKALGNALKNAISNRTTVNVSSYNSGSSKAQSLGLPSGFSSYLDSPHFDPADSLANYLNGSTGEGLDNGYSTGGGGASYAPPSTPQKLSYIDAPYAEMYGMDASTAYQEALANTAYQRKVKDLKAAGLNPVLGYSGSGAASFYGTPDAGVSYSGGVSYGSSGSGKTTSGLSDKQKDTLIRNLPNAIGGVVSIIKGPSAGAATSAVGNAIGNIIRYW